MTADDPADDLTPPPPRTEPIPARRVILFLVTGILVGAGALLVVGNLVRPDVEGGAPAESAGETPAPAPK